MNKFSPEPIFDSNQYYKHRIASNKYLYKLTHGRIKKLKWQLHKMGYIFYGPGVELKNTARVDNKMWVERTEENHQLIEQITILLQKRRKFEQQVQRDRNGIVDLEYEQSLFK